MPFPLNSLISWVFTCFGLQLLRSSRTQVLRSCVHALRFTYWIANKTRRWKRLPPKSPNRHPYHATCAHKKFSLPTPLRDGGRGGRHANRVTPFIVIVEDPSRPLRKWQFTKQKKYTYDFNILYSLHFLQGNSFIRCVWVLYAEMSFLVPLCSNCVLVPLFSTQVLVESWMDN